MKKKNRLLNKKKIVLIFVVLFYLFYQVENDSLKLEQKKTKFFFEKENLTVFGKKKKKNIDMFPAWRTGQRGGPRAPGRVTNSNEYASFSPPPPPPPPESIYSENASPTSNGRFQVPPLSTARVPESNSNNDEPEISSLPEAERSIAFKDRVTRIYAKYEPDKLQNVDAMVTKFKGREDSVLGLLVRKYGPLPSTSSSFESSSNHSATKEGGKRVPQLGDDDYFHPEALADKCKVYDDD
jgi:hypothetical protein